MGTVEACWAHNPEVNWLKASSAQAESWRGPRTFMVFHWQNNYSWRPCNSKTSHFPKKGRVQSRGRAQHLSRTLISKARLCVEVSLTVSSWYLLKSCTSLGCVPPGKVTFHVPRGCLQFLLESSQSLMDLGLRPFSGQVVQEHSTGGLKVHGSILVISAQGSLLLSEAWGRNSCVMLKARGKLVFTC